MKMVLKPKMANFCCIEGALVFGNQKIGNRNSPIFDRFNPLCECDYEEDFLIVPKKQILILYRIFTFKQRLNLYL